MTQKIVYVGGYPDSHTGDSVRNAMIKINENFTELYGLSVSAQSDTALTADKLSNARTLGLFGDVVSSLVFDGSADVNTLAELSATGVAPGAYGSSTTVPMITVDNKGRIVSASSTNIPLGTTNAIGLVQLCSDVDSSSITLAATPSAVKSAYDLAAGALPIAGGTITGNLIVGGNFTVNGDTVRTNSTVTVIDDPVITLGGDAPPTVDDGKDRGIEFHYHNGTSAKLGFFGYDDSTGRFIFLDDATNVNETFSGTIGTINANIIGTISGNAASASKLATARAISLTGDATGSASFDGSAATPIAVTLTNSGAIAGTYGSPLMVPVIAVDVKGRITSVSASSISFPVTTVAGRTGAVAIASADITDATASNTANTIVKRDASGNFTANTITAALTGNAATATKLMTARAITLTGDITGTANFDGSAAATIVATMANSGVTAGSYGSVSAVPVITVDSKGRITTISTAALPVASYLPLSGGTLTGDITAVGVYTISDSDGAISSGTYTPTPAGGNIKHITNGGSFTLAAPTATGVYTLVIEVTNSATAGTITFSGFAKTTGDTFTTTSGHKFQVFITKTNGGSTAMIVAMQ